MIQFFGSRTISIHLARGFLGASLLVMMGAMAELHPFLALAAMPFSLLALKGCPICWTFGLIVTVAKHMIANHLTEAPIEPAFAEYSFAQPRFSDRLYQAWSRVTGCSSVAYGHQA